MERPERHLIDVEEYYRQKTELVEAGEQVWVENFDVAHNSEYRFTGFFSNRCLLALIKDCIISKTPPRYPIIYVVIDGHPVPKYTAHDFYQARKMVEENKLALWVDEC